MDREPDLVQLAGSPGDGEMIPIPEGHDVYDYARRREIVGTPDGMGDASWIRYVRYRRTDRITGDGCVVFEVER